MIESQMKPPYKKTATILKSITSVSEEIQFLNLISPHHIPKWQHTYHLHH